MYTTEERIEMLKKLNALSIEAVLKSRTLIQESKPKAIALLQQLLQPQITLIENGCDIDMSIYEKIDARMQFEEKIFGPIEGWSC